MLALDPLEKLMLDGSEKFIYASSILAGDLVLRRVFENTTDPVAAKFQSNWEGLYMIVKIRATGSYTLNKLDRTLVPRMWNAMHLKRYYQ